MNIIDLGYDVEKLTAQQKVVVEYLSQTLNLADQLDRRKIAPDIEGQKDLNEALGKQKKLYEELGASVVRHNQQLDAIHKIEQEEIKTYEKRQAAGSAQAKSLAEEKEYLRQRNVELKASAQLFVAEANSIDQAKAKVKLLTDERNKLNLSTESGKAKQAELNAEIDRTNEFIQKNVSGLEKQKINIGNYASGWASFNNVIRETPNFAISATTGIQALSNNIPMFADEVKKARDGGKSWGGILKELSANLFSFGGIATMATVVLTAMPKILEAMSTETDKAVKKFKSFSEVQNEASLSTIKERTELEALIFVAKDDTKSKEERKAAVKQINDIMPDYLGNITLEGINTKETTEKINLYIEQMGKKALAQAYISKIQELYTKQIGVENSAIEDNINWYKALWSTITSGGSTSALAVSVTTDAIKAREKSAKAIDDELKATQNKFQEDLKSGKAVMDLDKVEKDEKVKNKKDSSKKIEDLAEKERKTLFDIQKMMIEAQMAQYKEIEKETSNSYPVRLAAANGYYKEQQKLIDLQTKFELETPKATEAEKDKFVTENRIRKIQSESAYLTNIRDLNKAHQDQLLKDQKTADDEKVKQQLIAIQDAESKLHDRQLKSQQQLNNSLIQLNNDFLSGNIKSYDNYQKEKKKIELDYSKTSVQLQIDSIKEIIKLEGLTTTQRQGFLTQISDLEKKLGDISVENLNNSTNKSNKNIIEKVSHTINTAQSLQSAAQSLIDSGYQREYDALQKNRELSNQKYSEEIKNIEASNLSQQDKTAKIVQLNAEQQAIELQTEKRQREIKNRQAKADRAFAVANIIENTAVAIASAWKLPTPFNFIEASLIGALGAVQLATVISKPIPQYADGTDNHPGGPAIVGEGKHKELVTKPSGESFIADKPMLIDLPAGTTVQPLTQNDVNQIMYNAMISKTSDLLIMQERAEQIRKRIEDAKSREQIELLKKIAGKDLSVRTNNEIHIDYGFTEYINKQVFGR